MVGNVVMVRPSFNGQVQAARLPTPTSPDNPFKPETNDAETSPQGRALEVYMSDFFVIVVFIVLSAL